MNAVQGELEGQGGDNITVGLHRRLHGLGLYSQVMSRELSSYLRTFHVGCSSTRAIFNGQKTSGDTWFLPANVSSISGIVMTGFLVEGEQMQGLVLIAISER